MEDLNQMNWIPEDFCIPNYILSPDLPAETISYVPTCPVILFINTRSGAQLGSHLLLTYRKLLNEHQVFDLGENAPGTVIRDLYSNMENLQSHGDYLAAEIHKRLRLVVAGGDGTASWLLGVVSDLKLSNPPPIAPMPLGTGNNLHFSFGWGKRNPGKDLQSAISFLQTVKSAREIKIDSWLFTLRICSNSPIAQLELPHSVHEFQSVPRVELQGQEKIYTFKGGFWNYFSIGMDAQVSYSFHMDRKLQPQKYKNQLTNQMMYLKLGCKQGWFCASLIHPASRNISNLGEVKTMNKLGHWEKLVIPPSIRSIVCLNLPSFSGGLNPWGTPSASKAKERDLTPPFVDDGLVEIVGFKDAWHGLVLLCPRGHGTRLAQACGVRFEFKKGSAEHAYMRVDGEPWKQPLPQDNGQVILEITHSGSAKMLASSNCIARSVHDVQ